MSDSDAPDDSASPDARQPAAASVTLCITELDPGGAEKALVRVAIGLQKLGWHVSVVSLRNAGELARPLQAAGIQVHALSCGGFLDVRAVFRLRRLLAQQKPDVLLCFLHQANIAGRLAGWLAGVRTVVSGIRVADRRSSVIWTDRCSRRLSRHYVAVSRHVAEVHARLCGIPASQMSVIHNGVEIPRSRAQPVRREDEPFRILFVGRLTAQKRPQDLVAAVSQLPQDKQQRLIVDVLGDGELRATLQQQIADNQLSQVIHLHGYRSDVEDWMTQADLLVLPSAWEGLPNVVLEAMACGLPVIASDVDGVAEVLDDGSSGWLVPAGDVTALSAAIDRVTDDAELRQVVSARAFEDVQQRFCWDKTIRDYDHLLRRLLTDDADVEKST